MDIKQTVRTEAGEVTFQGTLSQEEADLVIEIGLLTLLQSGAISFMSPGEEEEQVLQ